MPSSSTTPDREAVCAVDALTDFVVSLAARLEPPGLLSQETIKVIDQRLEAAFAEVRAEPTAELDAVRAELAARTEDVAFLERATLPELRRTVQHHIDGKARWRARAEKAEARVSAVLDLCDREQRNAMRWEDPIPVPDWVATVQGLALGDIKPGTEAAR